MVHTVFATTTDLSRGGVELLEAVGARLLTLPAGGDERDVERILATERVDAVISRTLPLSPAAIASCPTLQVISKHGVGVGNIAVDEATARGIPVYVTPGANAQSVAELTVALMLAAARRVVWLDHELRAGRWSRAQDGIQLHGRTLGLVGVGQIGQKVAAIAQSIGMRVVAYDPGLGTASPQPGITMAPTLDALLPEADVLSLHVPLTTHTRSLIGAGELAQLPHGAIIVNTARGEVIDEPALIEALRSRRVFAAGLDTTWNEPLDPHDPLLELPNVVLTPHVGGSTPSALDAMASTAARNVLDYLDGTPPPPRFCVNPETLTTERSVS